MNAKELIEQCKRLWPAAAQITVEYSGSGDEGGIDSIDASGITADGQATQVGECSNELRTIIENWFYGQICESHGIDFNNDGSSGIVVIETIPGTVTLQHGWYSTEYNEEGPTVLE